MKTYTVKHGSIKLEVQPWTHSSGKTYWRATYYESNGKRRHITRAELKDAREAAFKKAQELSKGVIDFSALSPQQVRGVQRMLEADPQLAHVDEFLAWHGRKYPVKQLGEAVEELIAEVERNKGDSIQNLRTLRKNLRPFAKAFPERSIGDITVKEIADFVGNPKWGNRTRKNVRASIVTLYRWAQAREYVAEGKTPPERTATPIAKRKTPETWTPAEMALLLANVRPEYLSWLAACAFGGFRTDEIYPLTGGTKIPLDWSDFQWERDLIVVRAETSKTERRVVPILPALRAWLWPIRKPAGPVGGALHAPTKQGRGKGAIAETKRLGQLVGGWRKNAIRHSWISYRAALVGIGQASMEAGNSESEAKKSYNDAKGRDEANTWFGLVPENSGEHSP